MSPASSITVSPAIFRTRSGNLASIPGPLKPVVRLIQRYSNGEADRDAAALAYGTLIVTIPLLALVASISGWALRGHDTLRGEIAQAVERAIPGGGAMIEAGIGGLGRSAPTLTAIAAVLTAWTSVSLVSRLRTAVERAWRDPPFPGVKASLMARVHDLVLGLALSAIVLGSALMSSLAVADRLPDWGPLLARGVSLLVGMTVDGVIILIAMTTLPRHRHRVRSVLAPALAAVLGVTAVKTIGASLVRGAAERAGPGYGIGVGMIAAALSVYVAVRILLLAIHWAAMRRDREEAGVTPRLEPD